MPITPVNDPIIITGGSMHVAFQPDFDDEYNGGKKVKKVKNPGDLSAVITGLVVKDEAGNTIHTYTLPPELAGKCKICIKAGIQT
ncbi:MAG TPA: hypothetical protein VF723_13455 [Pyrinomonadaceae bacterium]|jgi:hypothetical protein